MAIYIASYPGPTHKPHPQVSTIFPSWVWPGYEARLYCHLGDATIVTNASHMTDQGCIYDGVEGGKYFVNRGAQEFWCALIIQYPKISKGGEGSES